MIKIAYNKEKPNLVYEIDKIEREGMSTGIVEKYVGTMKNTEDNTELENVKIAVVGFDAYWEDVPMNVVNTGTEINNQNKEVTPTTSVQNIKADVGYTGLGTVKVNGAPLETAEVTLSTSAQTITATGEGKIGLSSVSVPAVTSAIDANIVAGNIKKDVTILGVTGTYEGATDPWAPTFVNVSSPALDLVDSTATNVDCTNILSGYITANSVFLMFDLTKADSNTLAYMFGDPAIVGNYTGDMFVIDQTSATLLETYAPNYVNVNIIH